MNGKIYQPYLETSVYTYSGAYREYLASLPGDIPSLGRLVCDQLTHPTLFYTPPSPYLEDTYFGKFSSYPRERFLDEDELFVTAAAMMAEIFRLDGRGVVTGKDVTKRITVSCRHASVLFSAVLKARGIPCRSRAGFVDFGNDGAGYTEHWVNEYWSFAENRWILADVDGYYEYERRFGYSQFDLPRHKFLTASEVWLGLRDKTLNKKIELYAVGQDVLEGVCGYLFMDFHSLMNNEIFYSHQPKYLCRRFHLLSREELTELDELALLIKRDPDAVIHKKQELMRLHEKFFLLTNSNMNELCDFYEAQDSGAGRRL
ncbi:MAG: transglutaminase-like domain-containing protein [Acetatifactor sp.]|nr:transglutaminase-like domain-containing protein [Acetatifactor sp.]MDE7044521.1 transglutaminase-like domain-containing protein [Acetatifactor sp.]